MAITSKGIEQWKVDNAEQLMSMIDDGYLTEKEVAKISDGDVNSRIKAFNELGEKIQEMYSDATLNLADENDLFDEDVIENLRKFRESIVKMLPKSSLSLSGKIIEQIDAFDNPDNPDPVLKALKEQLKGIKSDQETREFIDINGESLYTNLGENVINNIPDLGKYIVDEKAPDYDVADTDFDEMFKVVGIERNVLDNFDDIPVYKIARVAEQNGMSTAELVSRIQDARIAKRRDNIAHGRWNSKDGFWTNIRNELQGAVLTLAAQRQQEAIARGEDPSDKDLLLDAAEHLIFGPAGKIGKGLKFLRATGVGSKVGGKIGAKVVDKVGKGLGVLGGTPVARGVKYLGGTAPGKIATNIAGHTVAPAVAEVMDANAYDEDTNPRGDFSWGDVIKGGLVNAAIPFTIDKFGGFGKKYGGGDGVTKKVGNTAKEIVDEVREQLSKEKDIIREFRKIPKKRQQPAQSAVEDFIDGFPPEQQPRLTNLIESYIESTPESRAQYSRNLQRVLDVAEAPGVTRQSKIKYNVKNKIKPKNIKDNERLTKPQKNIWDEFPALNETINAPSAGDLFAKEALGGSVTNRLGNVVYDNEAVNIPMDIDFITDINRGIQNRKEEKDRARAKKKAIESHQKRTDELQKAIEGKRRAREQMQGVEKNLRRPGDISINRLFNNIWSV